MRSRVGRLFLAVFLSVLVAFTVQGEVMEAASPENSTIKISPVRVVLFVDAPEGGKAAYHEWFVSVAPVLQAPKEIRRIRSYDNVDPTVSPQLLIEFEFDSFLDMAAYLDRADIAKIMADHPNRASDISVHTFIRRSDYAKKEKSATPIKKVFFVNYPVGKKQAYLTWIKSISGTLGEIPQLKASASYDNYYGSTPHRFAEHEFANLEGAAAYDALEFVKAIRSELDVRTASWSQHTFALRSDYMRAEVPEGMVLIPAGAFEMGRNDGPKDERPRHTVYVDAFYIDRYEVTNAQYRQFIRANPQWQKENIAERFHDGTYLRLWNKNDYPVGRGDYPVNYVSWYAAMAYAQWAGKRLPTEAEWEKAARGGLVGKAYPWGDATNPNNANHARYINDTEPVGQYAPNGYKVYDMAGNVWEWCLDEYDKTFYDKSAKQNLFIENEGMLKVVIDDFKTIKTARVFRGGCWTDNILFIRVDNRDAGLPNYASAFGGFRCVRIPSN